MTFHLLVLAGALVGLGLTVLARELLPSRPDLTDALARLDGATTTSTYSPSSLPGQQPGRRDRWRDRLGAGLARETARRRLPIPTRELALLGRPVEDFLLTKTGLAVLGLAFPYLLTTGMAVLGQSLPLVLPALASLGLAAALFFIPDLDIRSQARERRREFRRAVCAYLDLVALERAGDAGVAEALERAAGIGNGWAFRRIHDALLRARLDGRPPWTGLRQLATDLDLPELGDVADIMRLSGEDGAAVYHTLRARARSLRTAILTDHEARANSDSEKLVAPVALLGLVFIALLGYPAFARIVFG